MLNMKRDLTADDCAMINQSISQLLQYLNEYYAKIFYLKLPSHSNSNSNSNSNSQTNSNNSNTTANVTPAAATAAQVSNNTAATNMAQLNTFNQ